MENFLLQGDEETFYIDLKHVIEVCLGLIGDEAVLSGCSGIIKCVIETPYRFTVAETILLTSSGWLRSALKKTASVPSRRSSD